MSSFRLSCTLIYTLQREKCYINMQKSETRGGFVRLKPVNFAFWHVQYLSTIVQKNTHFL